MEMLSLEAQNNRQGVEPMTRIAEIAGALGVDELVTGRLTGTATGRFDGVAHFAAGTTLKVFEQQLEPADGSESPGGSGASVQKVIPCAISGRASVAGLPMRLPCVSIRHPLSRG